MPVFVVRFGLSLEMCSYLVGIWLQFSTLVEGNEVAPPGHQSARLPQPEGIVNHLIQAT
jgi:hypothetical protein